MGEMADFALEQILDVDEYAWTVPSLSSLHRQRVELVCQSLSETSSRKKTMAKKPLARKPIATATVPTQSPMAMVVYGPSGVGKTEFAAAWPDVGFIHDPHEDGINDLVEWGRCKKPTFVKEAKGFNEIIELHEEIAANGTLDGKSQIKTLVNDALTGIERLCFEQHCAEYFDDDWSNQGFYSYNKGPKNAAKKDWPRYIESLKGLWTAGINVILLAHSKVGDADNPSGDDYKTYMPTLDKEIWAHTHNWAKCIIYYGVDTETEKAGSKVKAKKADFDRHLYTELSTHYVAKNRYGLTPVIDAGGSGVEAYKAFVADLARARKAKRTN